MGYCVDNLYNIFILRINDLYCSYAYRNDNINHAVVTSHYSLYYNSVQCHYIL